MRAFEEDRRRGAYERQVERLLASPHFGERMATFWLDLVRYADSVGYHSDNARTVWPYRDYVVSAFNRNLPFDRFTAEQLAGDLLPDATTEQKIASGYNRLLQTTEEGGAQPKEYRAIYLADRVRNASTVWLGGTLGCAQCHDHKFDPFLASDFYSFGAFFADVKETEVGRRSPDYLPDAKQQAALDAAEAEIARRRQELEAETPERAQARAAWEKALASRRAVPWTTLEPVEATSANGTRVMIQGNDFSIIASTSHGPKPPRDTYTIRLKTELKGMTAIRLEALTFEELPQGGPGRSANGAFVVSEVEVRDGGAGPSPFATRARRPVPAPRPPPPSTARWTGRAGPWPWPTARATGWWRSSWSPSARARKRRSPSSSTRTRATSGPWAGSSSPAPRPRCPCAPRPGPSPARRSCPPWPSPRPTAPPSSARPSPSSTGAPPPSWRRPARTSARPSWPRPPFSPKYPSRS